MGLKEPSSKPFVKNGGAQYICHNFSRIHSGVACVYIYSRVGLNVVGGDM